MSKRGDRLQNKNKRGSRRAAAERAKSRSSSGKSSRAKKSSGASASSGAMNRPSPLWKWTKRIAIAGTAAALLGAIFLAFAVGFAGGAIMQPAAAMLERFKIDDAVGAVTVHGTLGVWGVLAVGIFASGYPALQGAEGEVATISFVGQFVGMICMFLLGFVPGYVVSLILRMVGMLRVSEEAEIAGLDPVKVPSVAYPEGISSPTPAE